MNSCNWIRQIRKLVRGILVAFLGFLLIAGTLLLAYRMYKQAIIRKETRITSSNGIESLERVALGGVDQWILIRAEDQSLPVLMWLHGGPGSPTMPLASQHDQELIKHFVVVHWDQRGAGKSYSPGIPTSTMVVDQFVSDTYELTQILRERFEEPKIYLIGHSWGTQVGMLTVSRYPEMYYAFIAIGQFVHSPAADAASYQFVFEQASMRENEKALRELEAIGPPPFTTVKEKSTIEKWINAFGGTGRQFTSINFIFDMLFSPDYTISDFFSYIRGMQFSRKTMFANGEYYQVNLFDQAISFDVPIYFFQGRYDYSTPGEVAVRYFEMLDSPHKSLIWFEDSAHFLQWEEPQKFLAEILKVLSETK
jgi:pimeloyl-ACP methyl ester carboxylesterase